MKIIPSQFHRIKVFYAREYRKLNFDTGLWERVEQRSDPPLDEMINAWAENQKHQIRQVSAPQITVYQHSEDLQMLYLSLSVLYVPALEGDQDGQAQERDASRSVAEVARQVESPSSPGTDIFVSKGSQGN